MTVDFALFLSPQGIALAHRQPKGHWALVDEVPFDSPDLAQAMQRLKAAAVARGGTAQPVLLVLPDDQILYTSLTAPTQDAALVEARIVDGLEGLTPYAVADLVYDWRPVEIDRVKLAVIARDTLDEAAGFAAAHGFEHAGFAAMPPAERFPGMPVFGAPRPELPDLATGMAFGPDDWVEPAQIVPEPAPAPPDSIIAEPQDALTDGRAPDIDAGISPGPVSPAQAAQGDGQDVQAVLASIPADRGADLPLAETAETDAAPQAVPEDAVPDEAAPQDIAPEQAAPQENRPEADFEADGAGTLAAILDISLDQPVTPIPPDAAEQDELPDAQASQATPAMAVPAPKASRGKVARPQADSRALTAAKPDGATALPPVAGDAADAPDQDAPAGPLPVMGFGARRGHAAKPPAASGNLISRRASRLGFGARTARDEAALHPDAAPTASAPEAREPTSAPEARDPASADDRPISKLAAQLARVRDASKARPKPKPNTPAHGPETIEAAGAEPAPEPAQRPGARGAQTADIAFSKGMLARRPAPPGPSLRMGMILTLVLAVLLALIAIWSALFLPDSPIARLLGATGSAPTEELAQPRSPAPDAEPEVAAEPVALAEPVATDTADAPPVDTAEDAAPPPPAPAQMPMPMPEALAALPDIDADFDLPALPLRPQDALPSLEETEEIYAQDGIWPRPPDPPSFSPFTLSDDIYIAVIDPEVISFDAVALADPQINPAEMLRAVPPPPGFGATIDRDARGFVTATPEGVLTPEGAFVVLGRPSIDALPRPREIASAEPEPPVFNVQDALLRSMRPAARPGNLDETRERQILGGLSVNELASLRPTERPASAQDTLAQASLFSQEAEAPSSPSGPATIDGTERAVAASRVPTLRPSAIAAAVEQALSAPAPTQVAATTAIAPPPSIPSNADVSRAATNRNVIRLRDVNLIGVTGTPSNRSALVRLPSGRFVRVSVGDRLDGGRVAAIGESSLQYVINGRNVTLEIPG